MTILTLIALVGSAATFGALVFFAAVVAPTVFRALDEDAAGRFLRRLFPRYYLFVAGAAALAAIGFVPLSPGMALAMAAITGGALFSRQVLTPRINAQRDRQRAGDAAAGKRFDRLHKTSVIINTVQLALATGVIVTLAA